MNNKISVIISTHNRLSLLEKSLECFLNQTLNFDEYEILVGDSYSTQKADQLIDNLCKKYPLASLRYYYVSTMGGLSLTRNILINNCNNDIVVSGDDDAMPDSNYLEEAQKIFISDNKKEIAIVAGKLIPDYEFEPPIYTASLWKYNRFGRYLTDYTLLDFGGSASEIPYYFVMASNMVFRKDVFLECGGYGPDGFGGGYLCANGSGEHHFIFNASLNSKYKIIYSPDIVSRHKVQGYRFSFEYFKARYFHYGICTSFDDYRRNRKTINYLRTIKMLLSIGIFSSLYKISNFFGNKSQALIFMRRNFIYKGFLYHQQKLRKIDWLKDYVVRDSWSEEDYSMLYEILDVKL